VPLVDHLLPEVFEGHGRIELVLAVEVPLVAAVGNLLRLECRLLPELPPHLGPVLCVRELTNHATEETLLASVGHVCHGQCAAFVCL
jgi:hypothetical protein